MTHPVSRYVPLLIEGDLEGLLELFGNVPRVNDPRLGWVEGESFERFVTDSSAGLAERQASVEHVATTSTALGAVEECTLSLVRKGRTTRLPVAIAAVLASDVLTSLHVYHSMWPLMGAHAIRAPILPARPWLRVPDVVERCQERLARGDAPGLVAQFDAEGVLREPGGEDDAYRGRGELLRHFGSLLANGGVTLERCSLTDDGTSCVLEYNITGCGRLPVPRQAGLAVYQRAHTGVLSAVRCYDDIERSAGGSRVAASQVQVELHQ